MKLAALLLLAAAGSGAPSPLLALAAAPALLLVVLDRLAWWAHRRRLSRLARPYLVETVLGFLTSPEEHA